MLERGPGRRRFAVTWMDHRPAPSVSNCAARRSRRGPPHVTREPFCPAPVLEHLRITHRCHHSGRTDRTNAGYAAKTPASSTVRRSKFNGLFTHGSERTQGLLVAGAGFVNYRRRLSLAGNDQDHRGRDH